MLGVTTINVPIIKFCETQYFASVQIIEQQPYNKLLRPSIFSLIVALGINFCLGGAAPPGPPELQPCCNRLKTLSAAVNAAKRSTRILLKRGETKLMFAQKLCNLGLVLNKLIPFTASCYSSRFNFIANARRITVFFLITIIFH